MVSSGMVSCIVFVLHVEYLFLIVMCVLMHVHALVGVNVSVIMCILVWIRVHVCVAPPIVVGAWPMAGTPWQLFESIIIIILASGGVTITSKLRIIMWNIGMAQKAKETRSGCLVHIVYSEIRHM